MEVEVEAAEAAAVPAGINRGEAEDVVATRIFYRLRGADGIPAYRGPLSPYDG